MRRTPDRFVVIPSAELRQGVRAAIMSAAGPEERAQIMALLIEEMADQLGASDRGSRETSSVCEIDAMPARRAVRMSDQITHYRRTGMQKTSLTALIREQLELARASSSGRSATTVYGGHEHVLRQTLIAIVGGRRLDEHANPGEATVHVLHGRVSLSSGDSTWNGSPGDLLIVPDALHSLDAIQDSAVLLTVAKTR